MIWFDIESLFCQSCDQKKQKEKRKKKKKKKKKNGRKILSSL